MEASPLMDHKGFVRELEGLIKPCGKNGVLLNGIIIAKDRIGIPQYRPLCSKDKSQKCTKEVVNALVTLYHQGKFDEILKQKNELINLYPDSVDLYNIFGSTNIALNQFKSAIGNFKKAIKINLTYQSFL